MIGDHAAPGYWSLLEVDVGIICLCLPSIRPLLARYMPSVFGSRQLDTSRSVTGPQSITHRSKQGALGSHSNNSFVQLIDMNKGDAKVYVGEY